MKINPYVKGFFRRGLIFGGLGPVVAGIVFGILQVTVEGGISLNGTQILIAIVSTYILAFLQAGASVFQSVEHWSLAKSIFFHFVTLYVAYVGCYLVNSWIPFDLRVIALFSAVFVLTYFIICLVVGLSVRGVKNRLNEKIR